MIIPDVSFEHLHRLSDESGLFEHAEFTRPRRSHGYCVDDVARGLLVVAREPRRSARLERLAAMYLQFLAAAQAADGSFHNRRGVDLRWEDEPAVEDWWGRALWGLGTAVAGIPALADQALTLFDRGAGLRSPWSRSMAFAGLGAAEVLRVRPGHVAARLLLADAVAEIGSPEPSDAWRWPEIRLRYANASLAEVLIAGSLLGDAKALDDGLTMLRWLVDVESVPGHLSVVPVHGWSLGEPRPAFDQQPIEVAALADACAVAYDVTGEDRWFDGVQLAAAWFLGANDAGISLIDPISGGGCDGLLVSGRNENQGAESTLALISTFQQAHRMVAAISL